MRAEEYDQRDNALLSWDGYIVGSPTAGFDGRRAGNCTAFSLGQCRCLFEYADSSQSCAARDTVGTMGRDVVESIKRFPVGVALDKNELVDTTELRHVLAAVGSSRRSLPLYWRGQLVVPNVYDYGFADRWRNLEGPPHNLLAGAFGVAHVVAGHFQFGIHEVCAVMLALRILEPRTVK